MKFLIITRNHDLNEPADLSDPVAFESDTIEGAILELEYLLTTYQNDIKTYRDAYSAWKEGYSRVSKRADGMRNYHKKMPRPPTIPIFHGCEVLNKHVEIISLDDWFEQHKMV